MAARGGCSYIYTVLDPNGDTTGWRLRLRKHAFPGMSAHTYVLADVYEIIDWCVSARIRLLVPGSLPWPLFSPPGALVSLPGALLSLLGATLSLSLSLSLPL
jgi:hypothetical protein